MPNESRSERTCTQVSPEEADATTSLREDREMSSNLSSWRGKQVPAFSFHEITPENEKIKRSIEDYRDSLQIAVLFRQFTGASVNGLMNPSTPPSFPAQLGCQGFVVIDAEGKFITTKSASFLERADAAFHDVERKLLESDQSSSAQFSEATIFQPPSNVDTKLQEVPSLPIVGYSDMDAEHEKITEALKNLVKSPDLKALVAVRSEFNEHSKNEEALLQSLGFGGDGGALSALKSHSDDHSRIVALVDDILKTGSLSSSDVNKVVGAIHQHAERFDVLYATDDSKHTTKLGS